MLMVGRVWITMDKIKELTYSGQPLLRTVFKVNCCCSQGYKISTFVPIQDSAHWQRYSIMFNTLVAYIFSTTPISIYPNYLQIHLHIQMDNKFHPLIINRNFLFLSHIHIEWISMCYSSGFIADSSIKSKSGFLEFQDNCHRTWQWESWNYKSLGGCKGSSIHWGQLCLC